MAYASFWQRATASAVDFTLVLVLWLLVTPMATSRAASFALALLGPVLVPLYETYFHARSGQTPGKRLMDIVVLDVQGRALSVGQAVLRSAVGFAFGLFSAMSLLVATARMTDAEFASLGAMQIAARQGELAPYSTLLGIAANVWFASELVTMLLNRRRRALHDLIAGTVVIERAPERAELWPPRTTGVAGKRAAAALVVLCCAPSVIGVAMMTLGDAWLRNADPTSAAGRVLEAVATYGLTGALLGIPLAVPGFVIGIGILRSDRPRTRAGTTVRAALVTSSLAVSWFAWETLRLIW